MDHLMGMPLNCLRNLVDWRVSGETFEGHRLDNGSVRHHPSSGESYTINNDLEPTNPRGQLILAEVLGNEDALDHRSNILLGVLGALPKVVWDRPQSDNDGFERDRT